MIKEKRVKVELIESYIKWGNSEYQWNDNHGELIRCKDCVHFRRGTEAKGEKEYFCVDEKSLIDPIPDGYCNFGERK